MNYLKRYESFIDTDYSIYEFFNELNYHYGDNVPQSKVKSGSDRFIGEGIYEKVKLMVDDIVDKFEGIDLNTLESRFTEFSDDYEKECSIFFSILGSNFKNHDKDVDERYNSSTGYNSSRVNKDSLIIDIIKDIIHPTLKLYEIGTEVKIRKTKEQIYVTDPKWNCVNFNIDDYILENDLKIVNYTKRDLKKYSVDKYFDNMYVPALYIKIGDYMDRSPIKLHEIEEKLDLVIDNTLYDIPYSDIIWDSARFKRKFDPNINIYEYNLKVILE